MKRRLLGILLAMAVGACGQGGSREPAAQAGGAAEGGDHRAALVVTHGDGSTETACIRFAEDELNGIELLERSGLPHAVEFSRSQDSYALCSLDGEGCDYPDEPCFCQPRYWSYWSREAETWVLHPVGISQWSVTDGSLFGTRWGDGTTAPAAGSVDEICAETGPQPSPGVSSGSIVNSSGIPDSRASRVTSATFDSATSLA